jgi:hypothetical protein
MSGYVMKADGFAHIPKDPDAKLTYTWNWTDWMTEAGVTTITQAQVYPDDGITAVGAPGISGGMVAQQFQGGLPGQSYQVTCRAYFSPSGEIDERTIVIDVVQR